MAGGATAQVQPQHIVSAVVVRHGSPEDAIRAHQEGRRIALAVGADAAVAEAFGEHGAGLATLADSISVWMQEGERRACLVLVRAHDVHTMRLFTPEADADLLLSMLTAHELRHCQHDLGSDDLDLPVERLLAAEVEADQAALQLLQPVGADARHDLARSAWMRWRNLDAFMAGKTDHWTLPWLSAAAPTGAEVEAAEALRRRAVQVLLHTVEADRPGAWEQLRQDRLGRFLLPWAELQAAIAQAYGTAPTALRQALRGPPIQ